MDTKGVWRFAKTAIIGTMVSLVFGFSTSAQVHSNDSKSKNNKDMTVTMLVTFNVKSEYSEQYKEALLEDLKNARKEAGNISMELYRHKDKENVFYFFERWVNQVALDEHFEKPYTKNILELNKVALVSPMEIDYLEDIAPLPKAELKTPSSADTPVDLIVVFEVKDGLQEKFVRQFEKSVTKSRTEAGNILFHFHKVRGSNNKFVLYERWRNQAALDLHFEKPYTKELFEVFKTTLVKPVEDSLNFLVEIGYEPRK